MDRKTNALNLSPRALAAGVVLSFLALVLHSTDAQSAETQSFQGSVHKHDRTDVIPIQLDEDSTINATLKWQKPQARMKLMLKRPNGTRAASKAGGAKPKSLSRPVSIGGTWRVVVKARTIGSPYNLQVTIKPGDGSEPPPPPPPPPPPEACEGVALSPDMDVQAVMDSHPGGTNFCFTAGRYDLSEAIVPEGGDKLFAQPGAILDGGDQATAAVWGTSTNPAVTVDGFVIEDFANDGPAGSGDAAVKAGNNWLISDNEIRSNARIGIRLGSGAVLRGNHVHHNGQYGVVGGFVTNVLWEDNEISYNNTKNYGFGDAGATKVVKSSNVTFRDNYVHHNNGNGLWADTDNLNFTYEGNAIEYNVGSGILYEVSYDAVIRNNVVRYNAAVAEGQSIGYGSNIQISVSQNVQIYGNTVEGDTNGIGLHDIDRGVGAYGEYRVANVYVHDNVVKMAASAKTGLNGDRPEAYTPGANNRFEKNTYYVKNLNGSYWYWSASNDWSDWRESGHDSVGTLHTW